jgi:hypothetical protein
MSYFQALRNSRRLSAEANRVSAWQYVAPRIIRPRKRLQFLAYGVPLDAIRASINYDVPGIWQSNSTDDHEDAGCTWQKLHHVYGTLAFSTKWHIILTPYFRLHGNDPWSVE